MSNKGLFYYKLQSPYSEDITKNCKLSINEIDSNFLTLKDEDIKSAEFVREEKTLVLTRNNGETLVVDLSDITYDLAVDTKCSDTGSSITISFDGKNGKQEVTFGNIVTVDNLKSIIGSDILTKVITDGTLKGNGTISSPLGLNGTEKTGTYKPVISKIDLTDGSKLPEVAKLGTRYATVEYMNDYGYLYNGNGLVKISETLENEGKGWRVPSKADWDALLNHIEPCSYQNHNSAACHVELGKYSGAYLKSSCGWVGQADCECTETAPLGGCAVTTNESGNTDYIDIEIDNESGVPTQTADTTVGVDKYGLNVLPTGIASLDDYGYPQYSGFKTNTFFWTSTHVYGDAAQDNYVKEFVFDKGGVVQEAACPSMYYSIRLVKDYDGTNYFDTEYIDGVPYKTILFEDSKQIWLASNYAKKEGFDYNCNTPDVTNVNDGQVNEKRRVIFLNEWNGEYWDKKLMEEGDTVVIQNPCDGLGADKTIQVCWSESASFSGETSTCTSGSAMSLVDGEGYDACYPISVNDNVSAQTQTYCMGVDVVNVPQYNLEYRVCTTDNCNQDLINTDDLMVETLLYTLVPILGREMKCRKDADDELAARIESGNTKIDAETERAERAEELLADAITNEEARALSAESALTDAINEERDRAISAETELEEEIDDEIDRAISAETILSGMIESEEARALSAESALTDAINEEAATARDNERILAESIDAEKARATEAETALRNLIDAESARTISAETALNEKIDDEIERATSAETELNNQLIDPADNPYVLHVAVEKGEPNLLLKSKDGDEKHFIIIQFDANFGEV